MRIVILFTLSIILAAFISCSNCKNTTKTTDQVKVENQSEPTSIVQNISIVTARVDEVLFKSETDYQIKATVLVVEQNDDRPSIAIPGNDYLLTPNFRYDNQKLMDSDINQSLRNLSKLSKGKEFKAEISLENEKGWFIQKVIGIN
jgi:hypothetical protein